MAGGSGTPRVTDEVAAAIASIFGTGITSLWEAQPPDTLYSATPAGVVTQSAWFDFSDGKRMLIDVVSTLDVACVIQVIGNITQSIEVPARNTAKNVDGPFNCPAGNVAIAGLDIGIGINDDWHPFIGVLITPAAAPTVGTITITAIMQK